MFNDRQLKIIELLQSRDRVSVSELTGQFGVSLVTVRQDLKKLEEQGVLKRTHGGAVAVDNGYDTSTRMWNNYEQKQRIAQCAASMVTDGETVIIETGSTCSLLARELASKRRITIITNSVFLCNFVRSHASLDVVLLGGSFQHDAEANVGPLTKLGLSQFAVDKCFIGADAVSVDKGISTINLFRAEVVRAMSESARKMIVLTSSDKIGGSAVASALPLSDVDTVITDDNISPAQRDIITRCGPKVVIA
ncbi:MAG: DeoR/GlpR family DNA-binding transcription regulator [Intestinimonas sp.]|nr:DeoR/GlpR family DNA-binding transcription regulator [Intestinimonas sp.]